MEQTENRYKPIINNDVYEREISYQEVLEQLVGYQKRGFGGIAINGRSVEKVRDISVWLEGYMRNVRLYCEAAKELGMEMWIFDEWGFPTGSAAGLVLTSQNRPKKLNKAIDLILEPGERIEMPIPERLICAGVFPVNRFAQYHATAPSDLLPTENGLIRYEAEETVRLVAVTWENISFHTMELRDIAKMDPNDPTVGTVDIMDRDCVRKFIENMHERYAAVVGDEFGKTIKGFFYDEPEVHWQFPYSPGLADYFREMCGYDLAGILPEIVTYSECTGICLGSPDFLEYLKRCHRDYTSAWNGMLADNFYGQMKEWCHEHDLLLIGHQDLDDNLETLNTISGDFFRNNIQNDMPGIDVIWDNIIPEKFSDFPRYAGSVKRACKKQGAMSETFALMGPYMPPDVMRYDLEHQIIRGIDKFFLYQNGLDPVGGEYNRDVMERTAFLAELLNRGTERTKVAVYIPREEISWVRKSPNPHHRNRLAPWIRVERIARELCYAPIEFDYVCEDFVSGLKERGIDHLIITGDHFSERELETLEKYHREGGTVHSVFLPCERLPFAKFSYNLWQIKDLLPKDVIINAEEKVISMVSRETDDGIIYAFLNESERFVSAKISFNDENVLYYDMLSQNWIKRYQDDGFKPRELKLYRISKEAVCREEYIAETLKLTEWKFNGEELEQLVPWDQLGLAGYTGYGDYETEFDWKGGEARIDLGEVAFLAIAFLNEKEYRLPFSPWCFRADLPTGHYQMKIRIFNSGASEYYATPGYHRPYEQPYLRCGLLGEPRIDRIEV